jgi:serine/threonine-protein kinase PpkA
MDIPGYNIIQKIGEGAMASVFLADQVSLGRQVALKVLDPALASQRNFTARFLNEGRIIAQLNHPQIVSVFDLGSHLHHYYLAMEYLPGGTLEQKIKHGMDTAQALKLITTICRSLSFAHLHGVIHRDIKPQNILFRNDDIPVLTDFGIARLMDGDPSLTIPGRTVGSPFYMSPEQICGRRIDERADLYAIGILFYEMLTHRLPYHSDQFVDIALMHKEAPVPVLPHELSEFQPLIDKLLAKAPGDRYASAQEIIDALEHIDRKNDATVQNRSDKFHSTRLLIRRLDGAKLHSIDRRNHHSDDTTQPTVEPSNGADGTEPDATSKEDGDALSDPPDRGRIPLAPVPHQRSIMWKKGLVATVTTIAVAWGLYVFHPLSVSTHNISKPSNRVETSARENLNTGDKGNRPKKPDLVDPLRNDSPAAPHRSKRKEQLNEQKIATLLAKAKRQLTDNRLSSPAGDNCYETYRQILSIDPSNRAAESLLKKIGEAYRKLAMAEQSHGQFQKGLMHVEKGLSLLPQNKALLALQVELKAQLTKQTRRLAQQARQIEKQKHIRAAEQATMEKNR